MDQLVDNRSGDVEPTPPAESPPLHATIDCSVSAVQAVVGRLAMLINGVFDLGEVLIRDLVEKRQFAVDG